jgi:hypothetical protein
MHWSYAVPASSLFLTGHAGLRWVLVSQLVLPVVFQLSDWTPDYLKTAQHLQTPPSFCKLLEIVYHRCLLLMYFYFTLLYKVCMPWTWLYGIMPERD